MQISKDLLEIAESMIELGELGKPLDAARILTLGRGLQRLASDIGAMEGHIDRIDAACTTLRDPATVLSFERARKARALTRQAPGPGPTRKPSEPDGAA